MRKSLVVGLIIPTPLVGALIARSFQGSPASTTDEATLREYAGAYQWDRDAFVYLQLWPELSGTRQLVAFDDTGELRTLYPTGTDRFATGPGAAVPSPIESKIEVQRGESARSRHCHGLAMAGLRAPLDVSTLNGVKTSASRAAASNSPAR